MAAATGTPLYFLQLTSDTSLLDAGLTRLGPPSTFSISTQSIFMGVGISPGTQVTATGKLSAAHLLFLGPDTYSIAFTAPGQSVTFTGLPWQPRSVQLDLVGLVLARAISGAHYVWQSWTPKSLLDLSARLAAIPDLVKASTCLVKAGRTHADQAGFQAASACALSGLKTFASNAQEVGELLDAAKTDLKLTPSAAAIQKAVSGLSASAIWSLVRDAATETRTHPLQAVVTSIPPCSGCVDQSYGSMGHVSTPSPLFGPDGAAMQGDGSLVLSVGDCGPYGTSTCVPVIARFDDSGVLDSSFGTKGEAPAPFTGPVALQADGKILVGGEQCPTADTCHPAVARLMPNGSPDSSFGTSGVATVPIPQTFGTGAVAVLSGGDILVAAASGMRLAVAKLQPDGSLDPSFGSGGISTIPVGSGPCYPKQMTTTSSGGSLIACDTYNQAALVRLTAGGTIDPSFGSGGSLTAAFAQNATGLSVGPADGSVFAGNNYSDSDIARFQPDGTSDPSFGTAGVAGPLAIGSIGGVIQVSGGDLVTGGVSCSSETYATCDYSVERLLPDGSPDPAFGSGGVVASDQSGDSVVPLTLLEQPDGRYVQVGCTFPPVDYLGCELNVIRYVP
jgi:uncharacterized delta-60 repeat protein